MNIVLWIMQGLLAVMFGMTGFMKLARKREDLMTSMGAAMAYMEDLRQGQVRAIGALELAGALGLILPGLTGILPILTPLAASGLVMVMVGAILTHVRRREQFAINIFLLALALFAALGRFLWWPL